MKFLLQVIVKALLLFLLANLLLGAWAEPHFGRISAYNGLFPGRPRFPFGETPREAYNFSLFDLDAMFAAHEIAAQRPAAEYRVILIGDSSVWGTLLRPEETLAGQLNASHLAAADGRKIRFYNLGYPTISLTKDLYFLDRAMSYRPDLVIWLVTLEAFPRDKQLFVPLLQNNPEATADLLARYKLDLPGSLTRPSFFDRTLIGRRKDLADLIRLQFYGMLWAATGVDQVYPLDYQRAQVDLEADPKFHGKEELLPEDLAFEVLAAGQSAAVKAPILLINEPMLISAGENSAIRYNFYYPRHAYVQYRAYLSAQVKELGMEYIDAWDLVPQSDFTNSAIHLNRGGTALLAEVVKDFVLGKR
jgi:hypothetical protein